MAKITYDKAFTELNKILNDLQNDEVSIDLLAKKSARANELLRFCKDKLRTIEEQVAETFEEE